MDSTETIQTVATWGYQPSGAARIFDLAPGEALPDGWDASPSVIIDSMLASAEALSAAVQGRVYVPAIAAEVRVDVPAVDTEMLGNALAEIDRLKSVIEAGMAENATLVAQIESAEKTLEGASAAMAELQASLAKAHEDGRVTVAERNEAKAAAEALAAELAQVKADLDEATKPKPATAAKGR
ncbi:RNA polymerase-interacting CarD/CdnL/TRCF family regulator [Methylobacterium sp. RAS18]|nr:RNA polymerase-interacting CarD/CdnL/TRCF family regulator [Methylobacterium sp. RAS18]